MEGKTERERERLEGKGKGGGGMERGRERAHSYAHALEGKETKGERKIVRESGRRGEKGERIRERKRETQKKREREEKKQTDQQTLFVHGLIDGSLHVFRDLGRFFNVMIAIHQHLGLDDRHEPVLLANCTCVGISGYINTWHRERRRKRRGGMEQGNEGGRKKLEERDWHMQGTRDMQAHNTTHTQ